MGHRKLSVGFHGPPGVIRDRPRVNWRLSTGCHTIISVMLLRVNTLLNTLFKGLMYLISISGPCELYKKQKGVTKDGEYCIKMPELNVSLMITT